MIKNKPTPSLQEALQAFHSDGALELIAGATLLNFGFDLMGNVESSSIFTWIPILLFSSMKNKNMLPIMKSDYKDVSSKHIRNWTLIPSALMVVMVVLLGSIMLSDLLNLGTLRYFAGFLAIALASLAPAFWIGNKQFFIISAVALAAAIVVLFAVPASWTMFVLTAVMIALGGRSMIRFSKAHPAPEEKKGDEA